MSTPAMTSVNIPGMAAAQSAIETGVETTRTSYNNMVEQATALAANWTGETASAFGQALAMWLADCMTVINSLTGLLTAMGQNSNVYNTTQDTNQTVAGNIVNSTGALGGSLGLPALG